MSDFSEGDRIEIYISNRGWVKGTVEWPRRREIRAEGQARYYGYTIRPDGFDYSVFVGKHVVRSLSGLIQLAEQAND